MQRDSSRNHIVPKDCDSVGLGWSDKLPGDGVMAMLLLLQTPFRAGIRTGTWRDTSTYNWAAFVFRS